MESYCGVQEIERAREGLAILLSDVWHSVAMDFGFVSFRILWIKSRFSKVKVCVLVRYTPSEGDGKEKERLWNVMAELYIE